MKSEATAAPSAGMIISCGPELFGLIPWAAPRSHTGAARHLAFRFSVPVLRHGCGEAGVDDLQVRADTGDPPHGLDQA